MSDFAFGFPRALPEESQATTRPDRTSEMPKSGKPKTNPKSKAKKKGAASRPKYVKPKGLKKQQPAKEQTDMQIDGALAAAMGGRMKLTGIKKKRRKAPPPPKQKK